MNRTELSIPSMFRAPLLGLFVLVEAACSDAEVEEVHSCAAVDEVARASSCEGTSEDATENAHLGRITVGDCSGTSCTLRFAPTPTGVDARYGAVFVTNTSGQSLDIELSAYATSGGDMLETDSRQTAVCDETGCDRRWLAFSEAARSVRVRARIDDTDEWQELGLHPLFENFQVSTSSETTLGGVENELDVRDVPGNVVQLDCSGIRKLDGDEGSVPRKFVSVLSRDSSGNGTVLIDNVSNPSTGTGPTHCVWLGTRNGVDVTNDASCPDWWGTVRWTWTLATDAEGNVLPLDGPTEIPVEKKVEALAFAEMVDGKCGGVDLDDERMRIRIADTTQHIVRFEDATGACADTGSYDVPLAVPFVATPARNDDGSGYVTLVNCSAGEVTYCDSSSGVCDPSENALARDDTVDVRLDDVDATRDLTWDEGGDPTVVVRKLTNQ